MMVTGNDNVKQLTGAFLLAFFGSAMCQETSTTSESPHYAKQRELFERPHCIERDLGSEHFFNNFISRSNVNNGRQLGNNDVFDGSHGYFDRGLQRGRDAENEGLLQKLHASACCEYRAKVGRPSFQIHEPNQGLGRATDQSKSSADSPSL